MDQRDMTKTLSEKEREQLKAEVLPILKKRSREEIEIVLKRLSKESCN